MRLRDPAEHVAARRAPRLSRIALATCSAVGLALTTTARAHEVGLSRGEYIVEGADVTAVLTFAQREIARVAPELDGDHDDALSTEELQSGRDPIARLLVQGLVVEGDGQRCPGQLSSTERTEGDGVTFHLAYRCAKPPGEARFDLVLLDSLPFGHRHLFTAPTSAPPVEALLHLSRRSIEIVPRDALTAAPTGSATRRSAAPDATEAGAGPTPRPIDAAAPSRDAPAATGVTELFKMGVEHILTGFDHLTFLLGLVLIGGSRRALLLVVTAFTVAHSITLGLAALGVWAPNPRIIEPAIALSIAYVGVENFFVRDASQRWRITFPFGLVHGFGFAGALQEIALPRAEIPAALVAFNLGVEAGQLAVLAVVLPLIALARRHPGFDRVGVKVASALIVLIGLFWFVERLTGA